MDFGVVNICSQRTIILLLVLCVPLSPLRSRAYHVLDDCNAARISTCSEQSLTMRSPASTWAYIVQMKVIDNQKRLSQLSRELECS